MRKTLRIIITLLLIFSLVACNSTGLSHEDGNNQNPITNPETDPDKETDPNTDPGTDPDPNTDPGTDPDPNTDPGTDPDPNTDPDQEIIVDNLDIYYLNDTHGGLINVDDQLGFPNIGNLIMTKSQENPEETLFITGGDILQGNIISNYYNGASAIDMLNDMGLEAFVLGNHEFDWGLETVTQYFRDDIESDVKANFPLLGANVFYDGTQERPAGIDAYTIIEKGDLDIGIIGLIGDGLESDIATAMVDPYYFDNPTYWAEYYATYLREEENVDMVIVIIHDEDDSFNEEVAGFTGDAYVDVIFNGHSHRPYIRNVYRDPNTCYIVQSGANGEYVGHVKFEIDNKEVTYVSAENLSQANEALLRSPNSDIQTKLDTYSQMISEMYTNIITSGEYMSQSDLTLLMSKLMRIKTNADIAFHNYGGTRTDIGYHEEVTVAKLYQIFPFDNVIKTVYLSGKEIKDFMNNGVGYDAVMSLSDFNDDTMYLVATNDYIFDKEYNPFINGDNIVNTEILLRDLLEEALTNMAESYDYFYLDNEIVLD